LREDEEAARELQRALLPEKLKQLGGYTFERRLLPSMVLSGDFVDYFPIGDREVGFYIADVSGHGAASAFVTVMLKTLIEKHRQAFDIGQDDSIRYPSLVLDHLNRDILQSPIDKYLTIFYGVLSLDKDELRFCSGGQFPYPMVQRGGEVKAVLHHDKPVGLFDESVYTEHKLDLSDTTKILLMSDGILELFPQDSSVEALIDKFEIDHREELPDDVAFLSITKGVNNGG